MVSFQFSKQIEKVVFRHFEMYVFIIQFLWFLAGNGSYK